MHQRELFVKKGEGLVEVSHRTLIGGQLRERTVEILDFARMSELSRVNETIRTATVEPLCLELGSEACQGSVQCHTDTLYEARKIRAGSACVTCMNVECVLFPAATGVVRISLD